MPRIGEMFPSKYLKSSDLYPLRDRHQLPVSVRIASVQQEDIGGQDEAKKSKPVLYFEGKAKGLVMNQENALRLTQITGSDDTDHWIGVVVGLQIEPTLYKGKMVDSLRFVAPRAQQAGQRPIPQQAPPYQAPPPQRPAPPPPQQRPVAPAGWSQVADQPPASLAGASWMPGDDVPSNDAQEFDDDGVPF